MTADELIATFPRPQAWPHGAPPLLVAGGLPGSGKSYFVRAVVERLPLAHLNSDALRLQLSGGRPTQQPAEHMLVHGTMQRLAAQLLDEGVGVVMDATNLRARDRRGYLGVGLGRAGVRIMVWCEADDVTAAARLRRRAAGGDPLDASDASLEVRQRMSQRMSVPAPHEADLIVSVTPERFDAALEQLLELLSA